eukprot:3933141-Rhodomonas_salina.1
MLAASPALWVHALHFVLGELRPSLVQRAVIKLRQLTPVWQAQLDRARFILGGECSDEEEEHTCPQHRTQHRFISFCAGARSPIPASALNRASSLLTNQ